MIILVVRWKKIPLWCVPESENVKMLKMWMKSGVPLSLRRVRSFNWNGEVVKYS